MHIVNRETALVGVDTVMPHPRNVNQGNIGLIGESIGHNGFYGSLVVQQSTGHILRGNHTWQAARQAGATEIPVTYVDVDDETALRILLVDNKSTREGIDDSNALAALLQELAATPAALQGTGYDGDALDELLADLGQGQPALAGDTDAAPEVPDEPITTRGAVVTLGRHRLMCGDASSADDIERLMQGATPDVILADPPYGLDLDTDYSGMHSSLEYIRHKGVRPSGNTYAPVVGDDRPFDPAVLMALFARCPEQFWFGADYYAERIPQRDAGSWIVWDKRLDEDADRMFGSCFELCWSKARHRRELARIKWAGIYGIEQEPDRKRSHPTQKPVALATWLLERYSASGDLVLDPFAGVGGCLLACERLGRTCYMMEIEPAYCDVIVQRWQDLTGQPAVREQIADDARVLTGT